MFMRELVFNVTQESDGGYVAVAVGEAIVTQGDTWDELRKMVRDATQAYFRNSLLPDTLVLHLVNSTENERLPCRRPGATKLAKLVLTSFVLAIVGIVLEAIFLPVGTCGNGGWSTFPVLAGIIAIPVFLVSFIVWGIRKLMRAGFS